MGYRQFKSGRARLIYDDEIVGADCEKLFHREWLQANSHCALVERGKAVMFEYNGVELVFKQYHRGGLAGRLVEKSYLYSRLPNTRVWREFNMLREMRELGLPVPRPVAARCVSVPPLAYRGAMITERVADSKTLTEVLCEKTLDNASWEKLGGLIAHFHAKNVYHADLNANNILLTGSGDFYLIDFDKGVMRKALSRQDALSNVARLRRSLDKLQGRLSPFHFSSDNWQALERGYAAAAG
ncbi:3-deoxy-D-manno-octulosonic acid kinase [Microbulbifer hydrolyticus]|uniref:3-deoxy-D-manno-octulosonic acid kinase n=1 Tax=Microbulbifer hydrolyticus TaxID=48074 RepID=A0A6P1T5F8_9GAMM|nr:3-deoxy-D-manno-octulosonic acid kinase [Microbulbifer hydrolyticus]MBB5211122.1 3-deoxy-D-manno-octulosonic acid kinase [Microbulbifer hydrolyticus]QHQ38094.1 3-deoxy-D-manno-octulosonic acid kinase [Microbulbifer hydrolyticus]